MKEKIFFINELHWTLQPVYFFRQSYLSYDDGGVGLGYPPNRLGRSHLQTSSFIDRTTKSNQQQLQQQLQRQDSNKKSPLKMVLSSSSATTGPQTSTNLTVVNKNKRNSSKRKKQSNASSTKDICASVLESADVFQSSSELLLYNEDGGKELLRAGSIDALIVLATQSYKNDFLYQVI